MLPMLFYYVEIGYVINILIMSPYLESLEVWKFNKCNAKC